MTNKMSAMCLGKGGKKFLKIHQSSASRNEFSWPVRTISAKCDERT